MLATATMTAILNQRFFVCVPAVFQLTLWALFLFIVFDATETLPSCRSSS